MIIIVTERIRRNGMQSSVWKAETGENHQAIAFIIAREKWKQRLYKNYHFFQHTYNILQLIWFAYLFGVLLIGTAAADRFNFRPILQCIPKDFFQAHRWIRAIDGEFITFGKLGTQLLRPICYTMRRSNGTSIAFYCIRNICLDCRERERDEKNIKSKSVLDLR